MLELSVISETSINENRTVKVYVNSRYVSSIVIDTEWKPYFVKLPVSWTSFLKITLKVDNYSVPCKTIDSFDIRRLCVGVARLELRAKYPNEWWREK